MAITTAQLDRIAAREQRKLLQTFNAIISEIRDQATLSEIVRNLNAGNVDNVLFLLRLEPRTWEPLSEAIRESYRTGGLTAATQVGTVPTAAGTISASFSVRSVAAEEWLRNQSARFVVEVVEPQREMVRRYLTDGLLRGDNPRTMALDLIGRVDSAKGVRVGGLIGMTEQQAGWVQAARQELQELNPNYLTRKLRDPRFDKAFRQALKDGKPMSARDIDSAITRMSERTLKYRGDNIARTESISALRSGHAEAIEQAIDAGDIERRDVRKAWDDTGRDGRTRDSHIQAGIDYADGIPIDEPFIVGGEPMMHVGDPSASAENVINCRCRERTIIDFGGRLRRIEGFS